MMTQRDSFAVNSQPARACRKQPAGKSQSARARWQGRLQQKVIACQHQNNFGLPEDGTALVTIFFGLHEATCTRDGSWH